VALTSISASHIGKSKNEKESLRNWEKLSWQNGKSF